MDKDQQLIYEAYLAESNAKRLVLGLMCALGVGCSTVQQHHEKGKLNSPDLQHRDYFEDPSTPPGDLNLLDLLSILGDLLTHIDEHQLHQLKSDLHTQLATGESPSEGWDTWVKKWTTKYVS